MKPLLVVVLTLTAMSAALAVNYQTEIQPIWNSNCSCHLSSPVSGGLNLSTGVSYANIVGVISQGYAPALRVKAGDTLASVLWNKIQGTGTFGQLMPQGGSKLPQATLNLISLWIRQGAPLSVEQYESVLPERFALGQNYPNPFNPVTTIKFSLARSAGVGFSVFNIAGEIVDRKQLGQLSAGSYSLTWNSTRESGELLPSGVYFYRIKAGDFVETKKMLLLK